MNGTARRAATRRRTLASSALLALGGLACGSDSLPSRPEVGYVHVSVRSTGGDFDIDGYSVAIDAEQPRTLAGTAASDLTFNVSTGTHGVTLGNVAANCTVTGTSTRTVTVDMGQVTEVVFEVVCLPTGLAITAQTTGSDKPDAFRVSVNDQPGMLFAASDSVIVGRLAPGSYTVALLAPAHCTVAGGARITVTVTTKALTPVPFTVTCAPAVRSERISFVNDTTIDGKSERWIGVVNVDGTSALMLRPGDAPSWEGSGTRLVFTSARCVDYRDDPNFFCAGRLQVIDPETGNVAPLTGAIFGLHAVWARVSEAIAFDVDAQITGDRDMSVLRLSSGAVTRLVIAGPRSKESPSWSPDGQRIAFACKWASTTDLCIVDANGGGLVRLTSDTQIDDHPAWSPDGTTIAFTRYPAGRTDAASAEIVLLRIATGQLTTLTGGTDAAWSRDGSKLVFAGADGLFVIGADGANRRRLTTGAHHAPAWRP